MIISIWDEDTGALLLRFASDIIPLPTDSSDRDIAIAALVKHCYPKLECSSFRVESKSVTY